MNVPVSPAATTLYAPPEHAYGDQEQAVAYAQRLVDAGADEIMVICQMGTVTHEASMETLRHWGEYVIPTLRARSAAGHPHEEATRGGTMTEETTTEETTTEETPWTA
ncbi:MAG: hypothetical protein V9E89_00115 [Ilumatobacteraceae bacterium]